jgi:hypothetical protein
LVLVCNFDCFLMVLNFLFAYLMTGFFVLVIFRSGCDDSVLTTYVIQRTQKKIQSVRRILGSLVHADVGEVMQGVSSMLHAVPIE